MTMEAILIGYFPKSVPRIRHAPGVTEVCSVSLCLAGAPAGWIDLWRHNELAVYDTERLAESVVHDAFLILIEPEPAARPPWKVTLRQEPFPDGQMHAYKLYPVRFRPEGEEPIVFDHSRVLPLSDQYERLGYDVVQSEGGHVVGFGCSPLSCNGRASDIPVNAHCLLDDPAEALFHARDFALSRGQRAEPGAYVMIEVWRRRGPTLEREACAAASDGVDPEIIQHAVRGTLNRRIRE